MRIVASLITILCLTAGQVAAGYLPEGGITAEELARIMQAKGFQAEVGTDKEGDPKITSSSGGSRFGVYFYECKGRPRCPSIQFAAGFAGTRATAGKIAEWNRGRRFGRAYLDDDRDPWVEMDVDLEHGATTEAVANDLDRWVAVMGRFATFIGR